MPEYIHNKTNSDSYKEYLKNKQSLNAQSKTEVKIARIKENLETWERDYTKVKNKFEEYSEYVEVFIEENKDLNTIEPSILSANKNNFNEFRAIIYKRNDIDSKDYNAILNFMLKNKTEWAMRVFETQEKIKYPKHINDLLEAL